MAVGDIYWWVSNPLILLAAGSVSSGLLIPYFTRRWQDHQTELKLKVELLKDLTESVTVTFDMLKNPMHLKDRRS
jgi:hypothetical protein